ncbi:MAG: hypothetical protein IT211_02375 [Armatimonadetes bacterium]|nr:hypothetical protein [Armatimonadota bacterium]
MTGGLTGGQSDYNTNNQTNQTTMANATKQRKTISIREPFISLMVHGATYEGIASLPKRYASDFVPSSGSKDLEVRSWQTNYRGPILLHASRDKTTLEYFGCKAEAFPHRGCVVAIANLIDVRPMRKQDVARSGGSYDSSCFVWELADITPITPTPVLGKVGFFYIGLPNQQEKEVRQWLKKNGFATSDGALE